jgi:hypothetical protein
VIRRRSGRQRPLHRLGRDRGRVQDARGAASQAERHAMERTGVNKHRAQRDSPLRRERVARPTNTESCQLRRCFPCAQFQALRRVFPSSFRAVSGGCTPCERTPRMCRHGRRYAWAGNLAKVDVDGSNSLCAASRWTPATGAGKWATPGELQTPAVLEAPADQGDDGIDGDAEGALADRLHHSVAAEALRDLDDAVGRIGFALSALA